MLAGVLILFCISTTPALAKHYHSHKHHHSHKHYIKIAKNISSNVICTTKGACSRVVSWAKEKFQGLIHDLENSGYNIGHPGCLSGGHMHHSKHHWGGACDLFDQVARDKTRLHQPPPHVQIAMAHNHGLTSGCEWRHRDCGHFEVSSVSHHHHNKHYARN
jgi:hypothetical protein